MNENISRRGFVGLAACSGVAAVLAGCSSGAASGSASSAAASSSASLSSKALEPVESVMEIDYKNYFFDFTDLIAEEKAGLKFVPEAADIEITAKDEKGATGVILVPEYDGEEGSNKYFFNALAAGHKIILTAIDGAKITSAKSTNADSDIAVESDGKSATFTPGVIKVNPHGVVAGEIITVTMESGQEYVINTASEALPVMTITGDGASADDAGVYTFTVNNELLRINTDREIVYYRDVTCTVPSMPQNFQPECVDGTNYYSYGVKLNPKMTTSGIECGGFQIMDENYVDIDFVTLLPNTDPNHTHGEGYLDSHEIRIIGPKHYLTLSYTQLNVDNLPSSVKGLDGTSKANVFAGIFQEIEDGAVISEINTTDYAGLYDSAVESIKYSELQGDLDNQNSWCDYAHPNSLDYILNDSGNVAKLLVSMRNQSAVFQFDMPTGNMEWIMGGKASTLSGYDDYSETRKDKNGVEFNALTFGQHYARYHKVNSDGTYDISVFDNWTGGTPFFYANKELPTKTRVMKLDVNPSKGTAVVNNCVDGADLDNLTGKDHMGDHCGSVDYISETSTMIGWGLHMPVDRGQEVAAQFGLKQGDHCIFTDWNDKDKRVNMELNLTSSPLTLKRVAGDVGASTCGSYRSYKTKE